MKKEFESSVVKIPLKGESYMNKYLLRTLICAACMIVIAHAVSAAPQKDALPKPPAHSAVQAGTEDAGLSGKVVETMNTGGYTYLRIEKKGKKTWAAVPEMKVAVGQKISLAPGQEMNNFTSKTLHKTFDSIIFSPGPVAAAAAGTKEAKTGNASAGSKGAIVTPAETVAVGKAEGPDAYTVAEIYAGKSKLNKKTVKVRGKVVKVSAGIMGKNWVHLQDGSGDSGKGTHNLVLTTQDLPNKDDVVTMSGTLYEDKDFGAGYKYSVIVEEASILKK
jgi:hypothetical protein